MCIWPTLGARYAENRGQKVGHLAKMYDFRMHFALFLNSVTLPYIYLSLFFF